MFKEYDIPSIKAHHSLHKVTSFCTVSSCDRVQHLFERTTEICSKRLTAVRNYEGVQHFIERNIVIFKETYTCAKFC